MHMLTLDQLLARVVARKGYTIQGSDAEALLARRGEETLLAAWKLEGALTQADAQVFLVALDQVHAGKGLLVAAKGAEPGAKDLLASDKRVEVWPESRLIVEVGEAFVKDAFEATAPSAPPAPAEPVPPGPATSVVPRRFPSLIAQAAGVSNVSQSHAATFIPNRPRAQAEPSAGQGTRVLNYAWGGAPAGTSTSAGVAQIRNGRKRGVESTPAEAAPTPLLLPKESDDVELLVTPRRNASASTQTVPPVQAPPVSRVSALEAKDDVELIVSPKKGAQAAPADVPAPIAAGGVLKVRVTREEALQRAGAKPGSLARLGLVPHVAFTFDVHVERPGLETPLTGRGALLVNSLTGELRAVDALDFGESPAEARKDAPKLTAVDVYDKVKGHLGKTYAKTVPMEREVAGNTIMGTLKVAPEVNEMGLDHKGITYVPIWEIGPIRVDAYTGDVTGPS